MGIALCILTLTISLLLSRKRMGHGLGFVLAVGCIYGFLRANFLDGLTHFCFDSALVGLYLGAISAKRPPSYRPRNRLALWVFLLLAWPILVILLSPFLDSQHPFIQLVGLRTAVLFVPLILIGSALTDEDWRLLEAWAPWCVVGASCFAGGELVFGLEAFYPANEVTKTMYISNDIGEGYYRIPASFTSAHVYGGVMVAVLPLLFSRLEEEHGRRWFTLASVALASLGVFACGARVPVALFALVLVGMLLRLRRRPVALAVIVLTMALVGYAVSRSDRLRRFETLADTEMVEERVAGSVNMSFWEILSDAPMGRGLGTAFGTSIPFFLADYARPPVGIENEYGRLLVEEGIIGLVLWVGFVFTVLGSSALELRRSRLGIFGMWIFCASSWGIALIGPGLLASIPTTLLLMIFMGRLGSQRHSPERLRRPLWAPLRHDVEEAGPA